MMILEQKDLERLVTLEANTANIEKIVMKMDAKLDAYVLNYVTKSELTESFKWRDKEIEEVKEGQKWLRRMVATAVTGGILSLVTAVILLWYKDGGAP